MDQGKLDDILQVIENPVRRRIIKRLSQEPAYALQISKELGLSQALVAKHLAIMEGAQLVTSATESSSSGPNRKLYTLAMSISITMDLAPNLFIERGVTFDASRPRMSGRRSSELLRSRVRESMSGGSERDRLVTLSEVLEEVDSKIEEMESERVELLEVRNEAMHEASLIATKMELDKRKVLFHILDEHDRSTETISESLNLRELAVKRILEELEREFFG